MNRTYIRQLLLSGRGLLITSEGYTSYMIDCFPISAAASPSPIINNDPPTYKSLATKALNELIEQFNIKSENDNEITLSDDYCNDELPPLSIAYYRIFGFITSSCCWWFSTKQFELDLLAAEKNPSISSHFLHINSPGGEAWYLDRLSETMRSLKKPVIVLNEQTCGSAGYYIGCHSKNIYNLTLNDQVGCIGTMSSFYSFKEYYEKIGIKEIVLKSSYSDLKNKIFEDARNGKGKQFIDQLLDPLALQFIEEVKAMRPSLSDLDDKSPVLRGEIYDTSHALEIGLIDGQLTFKEAVLKALELGQKYNQTERKRALKFINF